MSTAKSTSGAKQEVASILEERKVKALEKIANSMDALTVWFEEVDKTEWGPRIEWYLAEWHKNMIEKD